jgi:adenylate cyclase class IV
VAANIEIKARAVHYDRLQQLVATLSNTAGTRVEQEDTFFHTAHGRLKLRTFSPIAAELIYYERENTREPKFSAYTVVGTQEPAALKAALTAALGVRGVVRKQRLLYTIGQTRIHLDHVEGLGRFIELEWVMHPGQSVEEGQRIVHELMQRLSIAATDLIPEAYIRHYRE